MTLASRLFCSLVGTAEMVPDSAEEGLFPGEHAAIAGAVDKRKREFVAGRICARKAMAAIGEPPAAILQGKDRAPIWPQGLVGCITHTSTRCSVAVARIADGIQSVGLDIEPAIPLKPELLRIICVPEERAYLESRGEGERNFLGKVMFSAKECAYKCQYALSRTFLDFHAMRLFLDVEGGAFVAVFQRDATPFASGDELQGRFLVDQGFIMTAMTLTIRPGRMNRSHEVLST